MFRYIDRVHGGVTALEVYWHHDTKSSVHSDQVLRLDSLMCTAFPKFLSYCKLDKWRICRTVETLFDGERPA